MATWVTHLIVADRVLSVIPTICRHEFCVGNIAPDCNVENEDFTSFIPSREVTHWMTDKRKVASDSERFLHEYMEKRSISTAEEESFLLGYYSHLITDAEFQRYIRDADRVKAAWQRIMSHGELCEKAQGMDESWDSAKKLIVTSERMKDIYSLEHDYLKDNPDSGYLTEIMGLTSFPDYIDYLPEGAIPRKIRVMGYIPEKEESKYEFIAMTEDEYRIFLRRATELVTAAIRSYKSSMKGSKL